jgi:hypothetical protein
MPLENCQLADVEARWCHGAIEDFEEDIQLTAGTGESGRLTDAAGIKPTRVCQADFLLTGHVECHRKIVMNTEFGKLSYGKRESIELSTRTFGRQRIEVRWIGMQYLVF